MSTLKKILIVFATLLIFIIIVEQPGSKNTEKDKNVKFFLSTMNIEEVQKIQIQNISSKKDLLLGKVDGKWQVKNGSYFPVDKKRINDFLTDLYNLKQGRLIAKNKNNFSIYSVDDKSGTNIQIWNDKGGVSNFVIGQSTKDGQFVRNISENLVYESIPSLTLHLKLDTNYWKDRVLLSISEEKVKQITLHSPSTELILEKSIEGTWSAIKPKKYKADKTATTTLFKELQKMEATSVADEIDSKKADLKKPDYKISVRMTDNSLKSVMFKAVSDKKDKYYAKNGKTDYIYIVSSDLIDKIFGLKFSE